MTTESSPSGDQAPSSARKRRAALVPPPWVWITVAICAAILAWIRQPEARPAVVESGAANVLTFIVVSVAVASVLVWFALFSGYRRWVRMVPVALLLGGLATVSMSVEIVGWSGAMVPSFRWRGSTRPDRLLEVPPAEPITVGIDLSRTTPDDFPQFLGPGRRLIVEGVTLDQDWQRHPPRLVWRHPIGAGWSAMAAVNGFAVTMEQRGPKELVTCYEIRSGDLQWSHGIVARHETLLGGVGPRSTPTIDEGRVYALGATGVLRCLDGATGKPLWVRDLLAMYGMTPDEDLRNVAWGRAASPLVVDRLVVVPVGGPANGRKVSLVAFDKVTGERVWEGGDRQASYSSPALATMAGVRQVLIVNESSVSGHAVDTGRTLWSRPWFGKSNAQANASQPAAAGQDRILVSKGYGGGAELFHVRHDSDRWSTERIWKKNVLKTKLTNVVIHDGHAYGLDDGILSCVQLDSGRRRWKRGRYGHGQILLVGDVLLVLSESGELLMLQPTPARHQVLGQIQALEGKTWNNLCLYGHLLLVRNAEQMACYELK